jgi:hypothetical protein
VSASATQLEEAQQKLLMQRQKVEKDQLEAQLTKRRLQGTTRQIQIKQQGLRSAQERKTAAARAATAAEQSTGTLSVLAMEKEKHVQRCKQDLLLLIADSEQQAVLDAMQTEKQLSDQIRADQGTLGELVRQQTAAERDVVRLGKQMQGMAREVQRLSNYRDEVSTAKDKQEEKRVRICAEHLPCQQLINEF